MALQTNFESERIGMTFPESYQRVNNVVIRDKKVDFEIEIYASAEASTSGAKPIGSFIKNNIDMSELDAYTGDDLIAKIYNMAKEIVPEYQDNENLIDV